jgi:hypothetical protein
VTQKITKSARPAAVWPARTASMRIGSGAPIRSFCAVPVAADLIVGST